MGFWRLTTILLACGCGALAGEIDLAEQVEAVLQVSKDKPPVDLRAEMQELRARVAIADNEKNVRSSALRIAALVQNGLIPKTFNRDDLAFITLKTTRLGNKKAGDGGVASARYVGRQSLYATLARCLKDETDKLARQQIAQALLILSSHDKLDGHTYLKAVCTVPKMRPILAAANLDPAAEKQLIAIAERLSDEWLILGRAVRPTSDLLTELIAAGPDSPLWASKGPAFVAAFSETVVTTAPRLPSQLDVLVNGHRAVCLARHCKKSDFIQQMNAAVDQLRPKFSDPDVLRWLNEVVTMDGDVPVRPSVRFIDDPNDLKIGKPE